MQYLDKAVDYLGLSRFNNAKPIRAAADALKVKPEYVTLGLGALATLLLVLTTTGQFSLMVVLVYLYPVYKSFKAREAGDVAETNRWLIYWTVFGFVVAGATLLSLFVTLPNLWLVMTVFFFGLYCALTDGQAYVYDNMMKPLLKKYERAIDKYVQMAKDEANDVIKRGKREIANKLVE